MGYIALGEVRVSAAVACVGKGGGGGEETPVQFNWMVIDLASFIYLVCLLTLVVALRGSGHLYWLV